MIIGVTGKKQSGKSLMANYLKKYNFVELSFAEPIKEICKILFNFTDDQMNGQLKEIIDENWNVTPRKCMQFIGTELFRNQLNKLICDIGEDIWMKIVYQKIKKLLGNNIIISDVRYQNEADMIKNCGGIIIKIQRNYDISDISDIHSSEQNEIIFDHIIMNDKTQMEFYSEIEALMNMLFV